MDTNTIVLVLLSICGGAMLVLLVSAYRGLQNKVDVSDYTLDNIQHERDLENESRSLDERLVGMERHIQTEYDNLYSRFREVQDDFDKIHRIIDMEVSEINKRIDSRVDKLQTKFDDLKEESHALGQQN